MRIVEIVFSPTGGTAKVARAFAEGWEGEVKTIDLADLEKDFSTCAVDEDDQVLIALLSFGGRVPTIATERLSHIAGNGAACTLICVYGNRAYEDTLAEMEDTARTCGFNVVAAVAAIAEHSIFPQFATGRPDAADATQLRGFARRIAVGVAGTPAIPGNRPYKQGGGCGGFVPPTHRGVRWLRPLREGMPRTGD